MAKKLTYQERAIQNYYRNRDTIMVNRLQELVSELYLAEGKARQRLWKRAAQAMQNLGVPQSRIDHLLSKDDPKLLANLVKELFSK